MNQTRNHKSIASPAPTPVLVAMSGGVDSSLAAALLVERGYRVTGLTMHLWNVEESCLRESLCCSVEATEGARWVCQQLGIPHYVFNMSAEFRSCVVDVFAQEYARGRTPNPCLACNREIKFDRLLARARRLGFEFLATGHYVRVERDVDGGYHLLRGVDRSKDQSYVLYMLGQHELAHLLFPLGEMCKADVRREAARRGLPTASRPESQEICFVPDNDYRRFLARRFPETVRPGPIRDLAGQVLGEHHGLASYTIGQRKGLGLAGQPAPLFVVALDVAENAVIVGPEEALLRRSLEADHVLFVAGQAPAETLRVEAKVRYRAPLAPAYLTPLEAGRVRLDFDQPQRAITPGQAAVFYQGEEVLGGGTIRESVV